MSFPSPPLGHAPIHPSSHILVIGDGMSLAHVGRALIFAQRLRDAGYRVTFATSNRYADIARQRGFEPAEIYCVDPAYALRKIRSGGHIFSSDTLQRYVDSDLTLIQRTRPNLVIADMRLSLNIAAELAGVEHRHIINAYLTRYAAVDERPPLTFPQTRYLRGPLARLYPAMKRLALWDYGRNFIELRKKLHLPATVRDILDVIASPHYNYNADHPAFMPCTPQLPDRFETIGPLVWEPDGCEEPPWMDELRQRDDAIYVSMGSTGTAETFRTVLETLASAGHFVVATTGRLDPGELRHRDRIRMADFLPGSWILPHCKAMVTHGGSGTLYQAFAHGVPVVSIPSFHDQEINAGRAEQLGWGRCLHPLRWTPTDIARAVDELAQVDKTTRTAMRETASYTANPPSHQSHLPAQSGEKLFTPVAA